MADDWRSPGFRQSVISKIDEAIRQSGNPTTKTAAEMEAHFFQRAQSKDDYLNYLARLLIHIKELSTKQKAAAAAGTTLSGNNMQSTTSQPQTTMPPVPQLMTQMNNRPQQIMNVQIEQQQPQQIGPQGVSQQQQQQQQQQHQQQQIINQYPSTNIGIGNPLLQQIGSNQGNASNTQVSVLPNQLNQSPMGPMNPAIQRARFPSATAVKMATQQAQPSPQQQQMLNQQLLMQQQRKQQTDALQGQGPSPQFPGPGAPSPVPISIQSMSSMSTSVTGQMGAPSPAYVHSPSNVQIASSPATQARVGVPQPQQQRNLSGVLPPPSPSMANSNTPGSGMLHTPQGAGMGGMVASTGQNTSVGTPGTSGATNEDQLYLEKVRQLSRFIDPLTRLIARYGGEDSEKLSKMKIMLDILSNPNKRMPMDTLLKCEAVLEKMDFKKSESGSVPPPSVASLPSLGVAVPSAKDQPSTSAPLHPLLETIANQARSPYFNHTLKRTFSPAVDALIGCDIGPPSPTKKSRVDSGYEVEDEQESDELMDTVEREIANMDTRFKVDLNRLHLPGSVALNLTCSLEDKYLPAVPPLQIRVPHDYPLKAPICLTTEYEYETSIFTKEVLFGLRERLSHLPQRYSIGQVLNCWEMALRHACRPNFTKEMTQITVSLGM